MSATNSAHTPFLLAVLDGVGLNPEPRGNAVHSANTPTLDRLRAEWPNTTLITYGPRVGLPEGQMGNSEVGHMNIGAGRVVEQELTRIDRIIAEDSLSECEPLSEVFSTLKETSGALHFIGLLSLGGVHSQRSHLEGLVREALRSGIKNVFIHAITDGRDRPPTASEEELVDLEQTLEQLNAEFPGQNVRIASVIGRYYAMDRDNRWERTKLGYDLFTLGEGEAFETLSGALKARHERAQTDEFIEPITLKAPESEDRSPWLVDGDALVFFNFRADRMRQLSKAFFSKADEFSDFERTKLPKLCRIASMTEYDEEFPLRVLFRPPELHMQLGEVLAEKGLRQIRIAETEKYPHVTYFFNGGEEKSFPGEERIMVPSPRDVPTYDHKPEMSAAEVTKALLERLNSDSVDVVVLNFANGDMVGHTGVFDAAVKAVETVDTRLGELLEVIEKKGGAALIIADHGNADQMIQYDTGEPHTYHTTHPVPCILFGSGLKDKQLRDDGALCDVAPTILEVLGITLPKEMTGRSLLQD